MPRQVRKPCSGCGLAAMTAWKNAAVDGPILSPAAIMTRIFALENHFNGDLNVFDEDEGHIGEEFEVNHEPGQKCTFTMRRRDGPIVESISFDRLSSEYRTSRRDG